ncbi:MAG: hypothetical protein QM804_15710 [Propionicimonas sp.]
MTHLVAALRVGKESEDGGGPVHTKEEQPMYSIELTADQLSSVRMALVNQIRDTIKAGDKYHLEEDITALTSIMRQTPMVPSDALKTDAELLAVYGIKL